MITHQWYNCYRASWSLAPLVPAAYKHPAKVAFGLADRIYRHLLSQGYVTPGDTVVDPFAGIGGFAFHAMKHGLHFRGVELEPDFVELARQNFELWNGRYAAHFPGWGTAEVVQGDSRRLVETLATAGCVVGSPPYTGKAQEGNTKERDERRLLKMGRGDLVKRLRTEFRDGRYYGRSPGQLGAMKEGQPPAAIVTSPAYADTVNGTGEGPGARHDPIYHKGDNATKKSSDNRYGDSKGQLGNLGAVIGSPPFMDSNVNIGAVGDTPGMRQQIHNSIKRDNSYGVTEGQLGSMPKGGLRPSPAPRDNEELPNDFWTAAQQIVNQCYEVLPSGGVSVWVTGDFVRKGERVFFGKQWLALCESVGFEPLEWITAWKREPGPVQAGIFEDVDYTVDRVSFFRRLANQNNPDNEVVNEDVIILRRP